MIDQLQLDTSLSTANLMLSQGDLPRPYDASMVKDILTSWHALALTLVTSYEVQHNSFSWFLTLTQYLCMKVLPNEYGFQL